MQSIFNGNCACHGPPLRRGKQVTLNELVKKINLSREIRSIFHWDDLLNKNIEPIYAEPRPGDIKHSFASIELIQKYLNFDPTVNFIEGLSKTKDYNSLSN